MPTSIKTATTNPFCVNDRWFWRDEKGGAHGPYYRQRDALYAILKYMDRMEGRAWHRRLWKWLVGDDTRGTS